MADAKLGRPGKGKVSDDISTTEVILMEDEAQKQRNIYAYFIRKKETEEKSNFNSFKPVAPEMIVAGRRVQAMLY